MLYVLLKQLQDNRRKVNALRMSKDDYIALVPFIRIYIIVFLFLSRFVKKTFPEGAIQEMVLLYVVDTNDVSFCS